jgi:hypothetical protein
MTNQLITALPPVVAEYTIDSEVSLITTGNRGSMLPWDSTSHFQQSATPSAPS